MAMVMMNAFEFHFYEPFVDFIQRSFTESVINDPIIYLYLIDLLNFGKKDDSEEIWTIITNCLILFIALLEMHSPKEKDHHYSLEERQLIKDAFQNLE